MWIKIAINDIRILMKERGALFWTFMAPMIFITFFGFIIREPVKPELTIAIMNHDSNQTIERAITILLGEEKIKVVKASEQQNLSTIVIPKGAAAAIADGKKVNIELRVKEQERFSDRLFLFKLQRALMSLVMSLQPEQLKGEVSIEELKKLLAINPTVKLLDKDISDKVIKRTYGFQLSVPQYMVMFLLLNLFTFSSALLVEEKMTGKLRRIFLAPVESWQIILGKVASRVFWGFLQMVFLIVVGKFVFNITWGNDLFALFLLLFSFALGSVSLGMYFATFFRNPGKCAGLGSIAVIIMSALGGCWWPLEVVPETLRYAAFLFPTGWAMNGMMKIMTFGYGLDRVMVNIAIFLIITVLFIPLASRRLRV